MIIYPMVSHEYANRLASDALVWMNERGQPEKGFGLLQQAWYYSPGDGEIALQLTQGYFQQGRMEEAAYYAGVLVEQGYPSERKALRVALVCALELGRYDEALGICERYNALGLEDETILEVERRLRSGDRVEELKGLFAR